MAEFMKPVCVFANSNARSSAGETAEFTEPVDFSGWLPRAFLGVISTTVPAQTRETRG